MLLLKGFSFYILKKCKITVSMVEEIQCNKEFGKLEVNLGSQ